MMAASSFTDEISMQDLERVYIRHAQHLLYEKMRNPPSNKEAWHELWNGEVNRAIIQLHNVPPKLCLFLVRHLGDGSSEVKTRGQQSIVNFRSLDQLQHVTNRMGLKIIACDPHYDYKKVGASSGSCYTMVGCYAQTSSTFSEDDLKIYEEVYTRKQWHPLFFDTSRKRASGEVYAHASTKHVLVLKQEYALFREQNVDFYEVLMPDRQGPLQRCSPDASAAAPEMRAHRGWVPGPMLTFCNDAQRPMLRWGPEPGGWLMKVTLALPLLQVVNGGHRQGVQYEMRIDGVSAAEAARHAGVGVGEEVAVPAGFCRSGEGITDVEWWLPPALHFRYIMLKLEEEEEGKLECTWRLCRLVPTLDRDLQSVPGGYQKKVYVALFDEEGDRSLFLALDGKRMIPADVPLSKEMKAGSWTVLDQRAPHPRAGFCVVPKEQVDVMALEESMYGGCVIMYCDGEDNCGGLKVFTQGTLMTPPAATDNNKSMYIVDWGISKKKAKAGRTCGSTELKGLPQIELDFLKYVDRFENPLHAVPEQVDAGAWCFLRPRIT